MPRFPIAAAAVLVLLFNVSLAQPAPDAPAEPQHYTAEAPAALPGAADLPLSAPDFSPGSLLEVVPEGIVDPYEAQREASPLFGRFGPPIIENAVDAYRVRYLTTGLDGTPSEISAMLFVPRLEEPQERPLYVFGSGTTGIADVCAPSREHLYRGQLGHARGYLLAYAGRGFTAIVPDYLGYDEPGRVQSYFNAEAEARVMLDAVRAVENFFAERGQARSEEASVFLGGYSQGGHAAFAAADLRPLYAPELDVHGIMGFGATTSVEALLREGPYYAPYILLSYLQDYGPELVDTAEVLAPRWHRDLERIAGELCVDQAQAYYPFDGAALYRPEFARALYEGDLATRYPGLASILDSNSTGLSGHGLPSLLVQGVNDVIVRNETQGSFAHQLCSLGSEVTYLSYMGVRHKETRPAGFEASIEWMKRIDGSLPTDSDCVALAQGESSLRQAP